MCNLKFPELGATVSATGNALEPGSLVTSSTCSGPGVSVNVRDDDSSTFGGLIHTSWHRGPFEGIDVGFKAAPIFGDVDGDGDWDLLIGDESGIAEGEAGRVIIFYRNTGTSSAPSFERETVFDVSLGQQAGWNVPTLHDPDRDGDLDLYVGATSEIQFYRNSGDSKNPIWDLEIANFYQHLYLGDELRPALGDLDGDGDFDMISGVVGQAQIVTNQGSRYLPDWQPEITLPLFKDFYSGLSLSPCLVDIDNDLDLDLFLAEGSGLVTFYRNNGTGVAPVWELEGDFLPPLATSWPELAFVDIDADDDPDLFVGTFDGAIRFFRNLGTPEVAEFAEEDSTSFLPAFGERLSRPVFFDEDRDGDRDLLVTSGDLRHITLYRNDGTIKIPLFILETAEYGGIDIPNHRGLNEADINGDRTLDILVGERFGSMYVFLAESAVFLDGFETGDTSAWSN